MMENFENSIVRDMPVIDSNFTSAEQAAVEAFERKFLDQSSRKAHGNVSEATRLSGIKLQSL